ncbi:inosose dehydratase [Thermocatellispora tengchongensis]|uniref:Inosose dehydratase n=1 Tax=Thermocatellispora tengchongensis TaxID=1073253 RepID=A0A840P3V1_9ACTN|nr:TIM barrel protein [Thermocatellispora tengchongensis]MBB5134042.1 inosose dehydratase [Thermocatellispora tengchongensis]
MRIAGAPISWGVCEVPGWGVQLDRERVLAEMRELGLEATELGPPGWLPPSPERRAALLAQYGLRGIGGFTPIALHEPGDEPRAIARAAMRGFRDGGVDVLVLAAATGADGYDVRPELNAAGWKRLLANLDAIVRESKEYGVLVTLHPHVGTMVQTGAEVERVLDGSRVPLCLDTGHLLAGGTDPAPLAEAAASRVAHVHLKDVDADLADQVARGNLTYTEAVRGGLYRPLGRGAVDVPRIVRALTSAGYDGWYVLEQDVVLTATPPEGEGPIEGVRESLAYLRGLA